MSQNPDQIPASRPAFVQAYNGVASVEEARAKRPANIGIRASEDGETEIVEIFDEIGGWGVWASELIPHLRRIDGAGKKVEVRLNSPGGDVFEGIAISNAIRFMKADTKSVVYGLAASAASVIAVSTDELAMPANSMLMIHRPWMITWGEAKDLRDGAELLDKIEVQLIDTYAAKAKDAKRDDLAQMVADETWLTAEEAVAVGLADVILDDIKMAASAARKISARRDVPAQALALLAGPDTPEPTEETTVSDEPTASVEAETDATETVIGPVAETPAAEATEQQPDPIEVIEPAADATEQDPTPAAEVEVTEQTPAALIEASVPVPGANLRISVRAVVENGQVVGLEFGDAVATVDEVPADAPTVGAEDGYPTQDASEPEASESNEEAIAIRAACAVLDASDKADGFIQAGLTFEEVRARLWDHRVAAAAQNDIVTQGSSLLAENPAAAPQAQQSDGPSALKLARQARKGRTSNRPIRGN